MKNQRPFTTASKSDKNDDNNIKNPKFCSGEVLLDEALNKNWMTDFGETIKNNPKTQKGIVVIVDKFSTQSFNTQSQNGQNALLRKSILKKQ